MTFRVRWYKAALDDLASAWLKATPEERRKITAFAQTVEHELRTQPQTKGESRSGNERILIELPLAILFEVDHAKGKVYIHQAWKTRKR